MPRQRSYMVAGKVDGFRVVYIRHTWFATQKLIASLKECIDCNIYLVTCVEKEK